MTVDGYIPLDYNETMLPQRLVRIRKDLGLNKSQFAKLLGTTYLVVHNWETGRTTPRLHYRMEIQRIEREHLTKSE